MFTSLLHAQEAFHYLEKSVKSSLIGTYLQHLFKIVSSLCPTQRTNYDSTGTLLIWETYPNVTLFISQRTWHTKYSYAHLIEVSFQTHFSPDLKTIGNSRRSGLQDKKSESWICEPDNHHLKMLPTSTIVLREIKIFYTGFKYL